MALQPREHGDWAWDHPEYFRLLRGYHQRSYLSDRVQPRRDTVRSVAGVTSYCGIPRRLPDGAQLRRDPKSIHKLAEHGVKDVYQFCPSYSRKDIRGHRQFLMEIRDAIAAQFGRQY